MSDNYNNCSIDPFPLLCTNIHSCYITELHTFSFLSQNLSKYQMQSEHQF